MFVELGSPDLKIGVTFAVFQSSGKHFVLILMLKMWDRIPNSSVLPVLTTSVVMLSKPHAGDELNLSIATAMSIMLTSFISKMGGGGGSLVGSPLCQCQGVYFHYMYLQLCQNVCSKQLLFFVRHFHHLLI